MAEDNSIDERISNAIEKMSPKHKRLARLALERKYFMSFASASQAGEKAGTSPATVVRFAQSLGYEGYSEMQAAIRSELPSYIKAAERIQAQLAKSDRIDGGANSIFAVDIQNIERTANHLSEEKLEQSLNLLEKAKRITVVGSGVSAGPAIFFAHSLKVIGLDARAIITGGIPMAVETAQLKGEDVLVAIDLWRYVRTTVKVLEAAKKAGAGTIAITDSIVSPLSTMADFAFEVATDGVAHSLSPTAVISLLNIFIAMLSYRNAEKTVEALQKVDASYRGHNLLITE